MFLASGREGCSLSTASTNQLFSNKALWLFAANPLWKGDKTYLLIFIVANIIAGQVGFITSLILTWQSGGEFLNAWSLAATSGVFYIYSISLVVTVLAMIGSEMIDAIRNASNVQFFEHKVIWGIIACAVLVLQAPAAGALLYQSGSSPQVQQTSNCYTCSTLDKMQTEEKTVPNNPNPSNTVSRQAPQYFFWLFSMFVALQLFCLYRIPFMPNRYAENRNDEIRKLSNNAAKKDSTAFNEQL